MLIQISGLMAFHTPVVKPAHPELHAHKGLVPYLLTHNGKLFFSLGAKISGLQDTVYFSAVKGVSPRTV